jgi:hypothetical protein
MDARFGHSPSQRAMEPCHVTAADLEDRDGLPALFRFPEPCSGCSVDVLAHSVCSLDCSRAVRLRSKRGLSGRRAGGGLIERRGCGWVTGWRKCSWPGVGWATGVGRASGACHPPGGLARGRELRLSDRHRDRMTSDRG